MATQFDEGRGNTLYITQRDSLKGTSCLEMFYPTGRTDQSEYLKSKLLIWKCPVDFEFTNQLSSVTISGAMAIRNNIKSCGWPVAHTTL